MVMGPNIDFGFSIFDFTASLQFISRVRDGPRTLSSDFDLGPRRSSRFARGQCRHYQSLPPPPAEAARDSGRLLCAVTDHPRFTRGEKAPRDMLCPECWAALRVTVGI